MCHYHSLENYLLCKIAFEKEIQLHLKIPKERKKVLKGVYIQLTRKYKKLKKQAQEMWRENGKIWAKEYSVIIINAKATMSSNS